MDKPPETREHHIAIIQSNWEKLAAECYKGYKEKGGRGMLILQESDFIDKPHGELCKFSMVYVAEGTPEFQAMGGKWPGKKESRWVENYTPEETVLIGFVRLDDGISSYRINGLAEGMPIICYQRAVAKNN